MVSPNNDEEIWAEELPDGCPPEDAIPPNNEVYFRLVESIPPTERDFHSHKKLYPNKPYRVGKCQALSCSLYSSLRNCRNLTKKNIHSHKKIVQLILPPESGVIKQMGENRTHFSWWRFKDFNVIDFCVEVE